MQFVVVVAVTAVVVVAVTAVVVVAVTLAHFVFQLRWYLVADFVLAGQADAVFVVAVLESLLRVRA